MHLLTGVEPGISRQQELCNTMKRLIENWNKFLDEAELGGDATEEPTAAGEVTPPTDQQIGAVEELLKTIMALLSFPLPSID